MKKSLFFGYFLLTTYCLLSTPYSLLLYAYPFGWSDDIMISNDTVRTQDASDIDVDDQNNVWVCWEYVVAVMECEICFTKRDSLGACLIPETNISNNSTNSGLPKVKVDSRDYVHIVWCDQVPQGMWHAKLANDGSVLVPAHPAVTGAGASTDPEIALNDYDEINIAWDERPSAYDQVDYTKLDTMGDPLIEKIRITPDGIYGLWPGIGVDSLANNHIGYRTDTAGVPYRFTYSKLDKDGNFLIYNKVLATGGNNSIVCDKNQNVHITYTNLSGPGNRIDYLKLDQNGNVIIGPMTISTPEILSNTYSHLAIDSLQYLHVVWMGDSSAIFHIMYCKMDTAGNFVIPPMKIVHPPYTEGAGEPRIAVDHSNRLHMVWSDNRHGTMDIFYKRGENEPVAIESSLTKQTDSRKLSVYPNPFSNRTQILYPSSRKSGKGKIDIFDALGRQVRTWSVAGHSEAISWDGTDNAGNRLPAGVYFVQYSDSVVRQSTAVILLR